MGKFMMNDKQYLWWQSVLIHESNTERYQYEQRASPADEDNSLQLVVVFNMGAACYKALFKIGFSL